VTHDVGEAFDLADRVLLMDQGKIVQQGKATELLFHPQTGFVSDFFSSQRMQLELHSVYLENILPFLQIAKEENNATVIDRKKSLWEAIELMQSDPTRKLKVIDTHSDEMKMVDYSSLFTGLEAFKTKSP
jgi:osmoprotectant transport system ATP-binding protein